MESTPSPGVRALIGLLFAFLLAAIGAGAAEASHVASSEAPSAKERPRLVMPIMNPERGKRLFVNKGCIACHAVNGVGGHDAPALDAHTMERLMNPFDFAAKMWNHAPGMIAAQEGAMGDQVFFTGAELADITAFVHDDATQHTFTETDLSGPARRLMDHDHGGAPGPKAHGKELGHQHAPGAKPHKD